jgi:hypothetical protein
VDNSGVPVDNPWQFTTFLLTSALVGGMAGWVMSRLSYMELSGRVSEMEAAVTRYWDRIRKRMTVEVERQAPKGPKEWTEQEIDAIAAKQGLRWPSPDA